MRLLHKYKNGNYTVKIYEDGTKIRITPDDEFRPEFPESIDMKITNRCELSCPFCHEMSTPDGKESSILLDASFLETLRPGTELAIGGGNPLSHLNLDPFLAKMKRQGVICNITVNEGQLNVGRLRHLKSVEYIHGVGVSTTAYRPWIAAYAKSNRDVVLHVINGVIPVEDLLMYADPDIKILILGYKDVGRGKAYRDPSVNERMQEMYESLGRITESFEVVSFDNLAINQLKPERLLSPKEWDTFYMGDDGQFTMYVDLVKQEFAVSSTSEERFPLLPTIDEMFQIVCKNSHKSV
jgi:hypothetical protein